LAYSQGVAEPIAALNKIRLVECGEPLVDLRKELPRLQILRATAIPFVRVSVAHMLANAKRLLPGGMRLGVREAWRSPERQKFLYDHYLESLKREHPAWPHPTLRRMTNRFFAPYDEKAPPGHSTGGAVDVWLLDKHGDALELHGKVERFRGAPTRSSLVSPEVQQLRLVLHDAMVTAGFTNCRDEWWHFSYGDAGWAVRAGRPACVYGLVRPDEKVYVDKDRDFIRVFLAEQPF